MNTLPAPLQGPHLEFAASMLKTVGHPVRLQILDYLERHTEASVSDIQEALEQAQPVISQHLNKMKALGLLKARRSKGMVFYSIAMPPLFKLLDCIRDCEREFRGYSFG